MIIIEIIIEDVIIIIIIIKVKLSLYRPWRPLGLRQVEAPTIFRHSAHRWREGFQPYAPAAFYPLGTHFC
jgi:hypothetical protein